MNMDPSECGEVKQCKNHLFCSADRKEFNKIWKRMKGKYATIVQA